MKLNNSVGFMFIKVIVSALLLLSIISCGGDADNGSDSAPTNNTGQAGSLSRFSIVDNTLYAVQGAGLQLFNISTPESTAAFAQIYIGVEAQTIFSYQDKLFIGAEDGVYIYDNSNTFNPQLEGVFEHASSCNPVVVSGQYAYITSIADNDCLDGTNQLKIVDVLDVANPAEVNTLAMQSPKGLGIDQNRLFVCDGVAGLKMFDISDPESPVFLKAESTINCYDVIANSGQIVIRDNTGVLQYEYNTTDDTFTFLSSILVAASL